MPVTARLPGWLRNLYDYDSHFLQLGPWTAHYLDEGEGDPVVMVHGNPAWSFMYRHLVEGLRDRFRVVVPDHIGCGLSDHPGPSEYPYTLEQRARDFADYQVDAELMGYAKPDAVFMHDMPAHEGEEVAQGMLDDARSVVFDQSENRLHAQKAILSALFA